jgi:hypothetical protein
MSGFFGELERELRRAANARRHAHGQRTRDWSGDLEGDLSEAARRLSGSRPALATGAPVEPRRRRRVVVAVAALTVALAVPAWATGLLDSLIEPLRVADDDGISVPNQEGRRFVLAEGVTSGLRYRLVAYNAAVAHGALAPSGDPRREPGVCTLLTVRPERGHGGSVTAECATPRSLRRLPTFHAAGNSTRGIYARIVGTDVAAIHLTFDDGSHLSVIPLAPDPTAMAHASLRFPLRYVAFRAPLGRRIVGLAVEDNAGAIVRREGAPTPPSEDMPVRTAPVL